MDLKELTAFQTILQEGSFAKAAAKLNYAQSTITNQIQRLEKELGFQLFDRGWEAELTPAGQIYAAEVDRLIQHWHYVSDQAKAILREETGTLRIGMLEMLARQIMPEALSRFREEKPHIACQFVIGNTDLAASELRRKQLDLAICGEPPELTGLRFEPLHEEKIVFAAAKDHPLHLHGEGKLPFQELLPFPMVVGGPTCLYYLHLSRQLARFDSMPLLHSVSQISAIPGFAARPPFIGVVLASTPLSDQVKPLAVDWEEPTIPVGLLDRRDTVYPSAARERLIGIIKEVWLTEA
ncbi:LysR family transcriptional regulator [Paenibacillus sp. BK720]|uniref:LysR substrate-binding domain-containing protein n=1 Tax=Paenibacillus sp. BK720 TaxID=2587092 RepID=UPI00141F6A3A|nr:LysR family transcriptional regulator [Paenibacillus sp. BK720]NIK69512.1 DNA-binding transcriptional LysR family regulator [Paenibacillus sp. BK720]